MMNSCNFSFYTNFVVIARLFPRTVSRFVRILWEFFFTARTRFNPRFFNCTNSIQRHLDSTDPGQPEQKRPQSDNRGTPHIWIRALTDNRGTPLIWIRALKRPPEPESIKSFFNYRTALRSRIAHSGQRSGWSGKKYVAVLILQCSINGSPLRAVNCLDPCRTNIQFVQ